MDVGAFILRAQTSEEAFVAASGVREVIAPKKIVYEFPCYLREGLSVLGYRSPVYGEDNKYVIMYDHHFQQTGHQPIRLRIILLVVS